MSIYLFDIFNNCLNIISNVFFWICYNSIYIYSKVQIKCIKINNNISYYSTNLKTYFANDDNCNYDKINDCNYEDKINESTCNDISFIEFFGQEGYKCHEILCNPNVQTNFKEYMNEMCKDFTSIGISTYFIYNQAINSKMINSKMYDRVLLYNFNNVLWNKNTITYRLSTHRFMSVQLKFTNDPNNEIYVIKLYTDEYNYYIFGNRINTDFVLYYCEQILKIRNVILKLKENCNSPIQYTLTIVDGDANLLKLIEDDELIFGNNGYVLQKYVKKMLK